MVDKKAFKEYIKHSSICIMNILYFHNNLLYLFTYVSTIFMYKLLLKHKWVFT